MKKLLLWVTILIISMSLLVTFALFGCKEGAEGEVSDVIRIGWTPPDITGVFRTATDYFILSAADAKEKAGINVDIITQAPVSHTAFGEQVGIIEDFIARSVDAIVISPSEVEPIIPAIKKANEAGI